jgi:hypothetical protein
MGTAYTLQVEALLADLIERGFLRFSLLLSYLEAPASLSAMAMACFRLRPPRGQRTATGPNRSSAFSWTKSFVVVIDRERQR